eukprot:CAMPEP_0115884942 /NCGR_PEP_ID=MMETSP0287-20121206/30394_1 /TAXON_ID=412157 /ORGANISM="Chrysochromulina rotalis, Strain UIO044" /LENGTH=83 /DNA_ID=CAMNT_0003341295 /DNA_START=21 /DNA_END=269 /DNA_ORIENTATION=+
MDGPATKEVQGSATPGTVVTELGVDGSEPKPIELPSQLQSPMLAVSMPRVPSVRVLAAIAVLILLVLMPASTPPVEPSSDSEW